MTKNSSTSRSQRAAELRRDFDAKERRRRLLTYGVVFVVVAALVALAAFAVFHASKKSDADAKTELKAGSGQGAAKAPPWRLPDDAARRIKLAGLDLGPMGTAQHYHAHLDILVGGKSVPVTGDLGIDPLSGQMSAVHTHDATGLIHVEAGTVGQPFTLGQLFTEWNVRLTASQLGSLKAAKGKTLTAYVNGKRTTGNPADIRLKSHQEIALVFGSPDDKVKVPAKYKFGKGE